MPTTQQISTALAEKEPEQAKPERLHLTSKKLVEMAQNGAGGIYAQFAKWCSQKGTAMTKRQAARFLQRFPNLRA